MTTEAIKALNRIAHFEAVLIIQDAARRSLHRNTHVQSQIGAAFNSWRLAQARDYSGWHTEDTNARVERALANLGLPILRDC